ncbi:MAG: hypothetical protein FWE35_18950 [Streptosporangiales bacterium]|nr:hypothetical protein [Streptosporangiales bacterium]
MTEQHEKPDEKTLLDLLGKGDIAGLEAALGMGPGEFGRLMREDPGPDDEPLEDEFPGDEDDGFFGDENDGEQEWLPRPEWLHPDCRNVCSALELGTCCLYPDSPLVRVAAELAGAVGRAAGRLGEERCAEAGPELARRFRMIPGLLAQIHALLPRLSQTARAQLLCPVGALAGALDEACGDGCPWGCDDPAVPDPRAYFRVMIELVAECSAAIRAALGGPGRHPVVVRPRPPRD